jgi:enoyl-CoA hydratase
MEAGAKVQVERWDTPKGRVGILRLNRPSRANAYDPETLDAFAIGLDQLEVDCGVLLVEASGDGAFCGGADRSAYPMQRAKDALDLQSQRVFERIARSRLPSLVAIQGAAVAGGMELCLACDLRLVGNTARFSLPETGLGLIPAAGGTSRLPRLVGGSLARQMILLGRSLSAQEAVNCGLALGPYPDVRAEARNTALALLSRDQTATRLARQLLREADLEMALGAERLAEALLYEARAAHPKG